MHSGVNSLLSLRICMDFEIYTIITHESVSQQYFTSVLILFSFFPFGALMAPDEMAVLWKRNKNILI
jgi:hypothetical protein